MVIKMKKIILLIKKVFLILLLLTVPTILVSCEKTIIKIGLLVDSLENVYVNSIIDEIKANINNDFELIIYNAEESQNKQNEQFLSLIEEDTKVFIVSLVDRLAANSYVQKCKNLDSAIIFFNKEPLKDDIIEYDKAYYVGYNIERIGAYQAQMIKSLFINPNFLMPQYDLNKNDIIEVVGLKINQGSQTSETMFEMCIKKLKEKNFNIKIVATDYITNREEAKEKIEKIYNDPAIIDSFGNRNIELVLTSNDEIALGVIDFLNEIGVEEVPFVIISANMIYESAQAVEDGTIYGTTESECQLQGQIILDLINSLSKDSKKIMSYFECSEIEDDDYNTYCTAYNEHYIYVSGEPIYKNKK